MKLEFVGTKGEIEEESTKHHYNSSMLIKEKGFRLLIDHGMLSLDLKEIKPHAILITHGHPDHFVWLKKDEDFNGPIYITEETKKLAKFQKNFKIIAKNKWKKIGPFKAFAYNVIHSLRAPAVGFKIKNARTLVYNPDLVAIEKQSILKNVDLYIGDGSSIKGNLVRKNKQGLFGHAKISTQINWCKKYNINNMIFTHFGLEALKTGDENLKKEIKQEKIKIKIAHDNMDYTL
jgi:ribonuclease BN (tRNA processing enzyme)